MSTQSIFNIREADSSFSDDHFVLAAFDSALPYLASIGSHEMWGLVPFTEQDGWVAETTQQVKAAENYRLTGQGEPLRVFIVEAELPAELAGGLLESTDEHHRPHTRLRPDDGKYAVSVGFAMIREDWVPRYISSQGHLGIADQERASCVYIEVMVTDHRVSSDLRKGSGAALIQNIKEYAQMTKRKVLLVDAWAGNEKGLVGYYLQQRFEIVCDFRLPRKNKAPWLGTLLRMEVPE